MNKCYEIVNECNPLMPVNSVMMLLL